MRAAHRVGGAAGRACYELRVGRPRDFDADAALEVAVQLFWKRGYVATSVRHLCEAMGIRAGSFYAVFGSKEECYRRALQRYFASQPVPRVPGPEAIRAWFDVIVDPKRTPKGCLLVSSAMEHPSLDAATQSLVRDHLDAIESFFHACLRERPDARGDAALLAGTVLAIHVRARAGAASKDLRALADRALEATGLLPRRVRLAH